MALSRAGLTDGAAEATCIGGLPWAGSATPAAKEIAARDFRSDAIIYT
jgi:hypothetical protein